LATADREKLLTEPVEAIRVRYSIIPLAYYGNARRASGENEPG